MDEGSEKTSPQQAADALREASDAALDAIGLRCPLPVLKARKRLSQLPRGGRLLVEADDPAALIDVPHFCAEQRHRLLGQAEVDGAFVFLIERDGGDR